MAARFRLVKYYNLPRFMENVHRYSIFGRWCAWWSSSEFPMSRFAGGFEEASWMGGKIRGIGIPIAMWLLGFFKDVGRTCNYSRTISHTIHTHTIYIYMYVYMCVCWWWYVLYIYISIIFGFNMQLIHRGKPSWYKTKHNHKNMWKIWGHDLLPTPGSWMSSIP